MKLFRHEQLDEAFEIIAQNSQVFLSMFSTQFSVICHLKYSLSIFFSLIQTLLYRGGTIQNKDQEYTDLQSSEKCLDHGDSTHCQYW